MHSVREELSITNWGFAQISLMACQSNNKVWHTNQSSLAVVSVPLCTIAVRLNFHGPTQQTFNYGHATQNGANNFLKEFCKIFISPRRSSLSWIWWCRPSFYPSLGLIDQPSDDPSGLLAWTLSTQNSLFLFL